MSTLKGRDQILPSGNLVSAGADRPAVPEEGRAGLRHEHLHTEQQGLPQPEHIREAHPGRQFNGFFEIKKKQSFWFRRNAICASILQLRNLLNLVTLLKHPMIHP